MVGIGGGGGSSYVTLRIGAFNPSRVENRLASPFPAEARLADLRIQPKFAAGLFSISCTSLTSSGVHGQANKPCHVVTADVELAVGEKSPPEVAQDVPLKEGAKLLQIHLASGATA